LHRRWRLRRDDLILWQARDLETIHGRVEGLAEATGDDRGRLLSWCSAFAIMSALELASQGEATHAQLETLKTLVTREE
jgi:hypothetical protein